MLTSDIRSDITFKDSANASPLNVIFERTSPNDSFEYSYTQSNTLITFSIQTYRGNVVCCAYHLHKTAEAILRNYVYCRNVFFSSHSIKIII